MTKLACIFGYALTLLNLGGNSAEFEQELPHHKEDAKALKGRIIEKRKTTTNVRKSDIQLRLARLEDKLGLKCSDRRINY